MSDVAGPIQSLKGILARQHEILRAWSNRRSLDHASFDEADVLAAKKEPIAVILPARNVTATIPPILDTLIELQEEGWIDELLVVTEPTDPAMSAARDRGVEVIDESRPLNGVGPSIGKGDAIWRGLSAIDSEIAVFMDTDTENFGRHFLVGMVAPLLLDRDVRFVKGTFRRPLQIGDVKMEGEGGRVSELVARPLLNLYFPELAGFAQPLAGEVALRRDLWMRMHIPAGYGVEIAMLIDAWRIAGLDALAQVDLGRRQDASKSLKDLVPMACSVMAAALSRLTIAPEPESFRLLLPRLDEMAEVTLPVEERPPLGDNTYG